MRRVFAYIGLFWRVPLLQRGMVLAVIAGAVLTFLEFGIRQPLKAELANLRQSAIMLQAQEDNAAKLDEVSDEYQRLANARDQIDLRFSAPIEPSELVEVLGQLSANAGTRILHGSNSFGTAAQGVTPVLQDLTVEGAYADIRAFIDGLASLQTLSLIRSVEFSANAEGTLVRAKIKLVTFNRGWN